MREVKELFKRTPFDDYDRFEQASSTLKEKDNLEDIAENELFIRENTLVFRKKHELFVIKTLGEE